MKNISFFLYPMMVILSSCSNTDDNPQVIKGVPEGTNFRVNYFDTTCQGLVEQQCLLVQEGGQLGTGDWSYFYATIQGFEFESGFIHNLDVEKTKVENPAADAPSYSYKLIRTLSKIPAECTFESPNNDLDWLRFEIEKRETNITDASKYCYISQGEFQDKPVFLYRDCNPAANTAVPVFDCLGTVLGYVGDGTVDFDDIQNQYIIWQPQEFVCQPNF
ncbi:DUF4377 domain-containing protein [Muricauda sp. SCSIO 64092]|uniref:DUF4377 domain-containing protein n=1 Tax=Allomuricauda sp. SCSIO 64092 TaxID=2908842 RepID=UPI001FF4C1EB|nr:DUF4377 domain-containing protein [Muricauda sp. SCSIO 64092]UOY07530.1 DUF4377 domain-containing protein [Muricauda sp. SCSIO 64092]